MFNRSQLIGRLGRDPEIRFTQDQKAVASLSVVTTDYWKDKSSGERKERAEWHRVILFGHLAEIARDHLKKGALVLLEGPIRTRKWQDQSNQERYTTEIHADNMKMLGGKTNNASDSTSQAASPQSNNVPPAYDGPSYDDFDDDIPF